VSDSNANDKAASNEIDPEQIAKLLELELMQKRAQLKTAGARRRSRRVGVFVFLFVIITACVIAFVFLYSKANEERANRPATPQPSVSGR
jgi:hypothetical protein